ncbi:MAG: 3-deoxy-7-phosphoheptulonate synthase [Oscillospiraceae bacterium]|nr:3-deoxy-7-phosphoheptulonate synthase [Oscillospiraceae bacterium]
MKNMIFKRKLPVPKEIKEQYPLTEGLAQIKEKRDAEIADVFTGKSDKMVLIIGPCSADREDAVLDYCTRLAGLQEKVADRLILIPRVYTNKPRTTGDGYKGLLHQPNPEKEADMLEGVIAIRRLHTNVLAQTGLSTADEMLYPDNYRYLSDLLSYVAVGARSVENQEHRLTASGIAVPVGMKNPTSGDFSVMLNSIMAAQHSHTFIYRGWEVDTTGNPLAHAILRGYVNKHGEAQPNYHFEELERLYNAYAAKGLENMALIVDANHSNSNKQYWQQPRICKAVLHSARHSDNIKSMVKGFMVESYIEPGNQKIGEGIYGKSITDACIGWTETEKLVQDIAELI